MRTVWSYLLWCCLCFGALQIRTLGAEEPVTPKMPAGGPDFRGPPGEPGLDGPRPLFSPIIGALDLNGDGIIDADEIAKAPESLKKLDKNGDGRLTPDEYRPPRPGPGGPGGPGFRGNPFGEPQPLPFDVPGQASHRPPPAMRTTAVLPTNAAQFFGLTNVWEIHLTISAQDWEAMTPPESARPANLPGAMPPNPKLEFPYVPASFRFQGQTITNVGIRYKGNSSYRGSLNGFKRPFKLDFNHFEEKQHFLGLVQLNLANNWRDPSQSREALAYHIFRFAQVPCSRTAFIKLYLTIPGKLEARYLGLYTAVEDIGKSFLKSHFESAQGLLLKPERYRGLPYLGEDWNEYKIRVNPKKDATPKEIARFIAFTDLIHNADAATFRAKIEQYLEVGEFLRFLAVNTAIANLDSILSSGHNYYLYLNPRTNQFVFIPWDLNESFGVFQHEQGDLTALSIKHPYAGQNDLLDRLLGIPEFQRLYRKYLTDLVAGPLSGPAMDEHVRGIEIACKEALEMEQRSGIGLPRGPGMFRGQGPGITSNLREFCARRLESINAQFAGKAEGLIPQMRIGPMPMGQGPRPLRDNPRPR